MVGRLIEEQHIRFLEEQTAESHTTAFTSRESLHAPFAWRTVKCCHSAFELRVDVPCVGRVDDVLQLSLTVDELIHLVRIFEILWFGKLHVYLVVFLECIIDILYAFHDVLLDCLCLIEFWILLQIAYAISWAPHHLAL